MNKLPELVAYCAGQFDARGAIDLSGNYDGYPVLIINVEDKEQAAALSACAKQIIGHKTRTGRFPAYCTPRRKMGSFYFRFIVRGNSARRVARAILPYSKNVVKRKYLEELIGGNQA